MPQGSDAVWLITGCSTGFGRTLAEEVLQAGQKAIVTARDPAAVREFASRFPGLAHAAALDVTRPDTIAAALRSGEESLGPVTVLVNNAGYGYLAAVEEGEEAEMRAMFEANFFGLVAVTKAVLPGMRTRGTGHVVNVSSVGGLVGFPGSGYYAATKFAVEGLSEALSKEAAHLGIRVTLVEPGPFRTDWAGRSLRMPAEPMAAYADSAVARRNQTASASGKQPGDPVRAAKAIMQAVASEHPPLHLVLGKPGLQNVRRKLTDLLAEIDLWEPVTLGADYPAADREG